MELTNAGSPHELEQALKTDHAGLETTFRRVVGAVHGGDRDFIRAAWLKMESNLLAHLRAEEELILPKFARAHPDEAARIASEHAEIRASLERLGIELDLHTLRAERADAFLQSLRDHADQEERVFYRWAQTCLPEQEKRSIIERLRALLRPEQGAAQPGMHDQPGH